MKIKERILHGLRANPALRVILIIAACIIALCAGLLAGACAFYALAVLFSSLRLDSLGKQSVYFMLFFVLAFIFLYMIDRDRRIKNRNINKSAPENKQTPIQRVQDMEDKEQHDDDGMLTQAEKTRIYTSPEIRWWSVVEPGKYPDDISIGFEGEKRYLKLEAYGYGCLIIKIPQDIVKGKKLDARKFEEFFRCRKIDSIAPVDYSDAIWIYEPTPGRPEGTIEIIRHLSTKESRAGGCIAFSFEKIVEKRELVQAGKQFYLRITRYDCSSGNNGRPIYSLTEDYHVTNTRSKDLITAENGFRYAAELVAYRYEERGTGVLY